MKNLVSASCILSLLFVSRMFGQTQPQMKLGGVSFDTVKVEFPEQWAAMAKCAGDAIRLCTQFNWESFLSLCDPEHRKFQLEKMKMKVPNYIAEILGIHYMDNHLPIGDRRIKFKDLEKIKSFELKSAGPGEIFEYDLIGMIQFEGWSPLELRMRLRWDAEAGKFWLYSSVG